MVKRDKMLQNANEDLKERNNVLVEEISNLKGELSRFVQKDNDKIELSEMK